MGADDAPRSLDQRHPHTRWWDRVPDANIGLATGKISALVVLDVDGPTGEATLASIEGKHGSLPSTREVKTGKGRHLYFCYPKDVTKVKSVARKKLGLDVRADGGYVIAPPSLHESGQRYTFHADIRRAGRLPGLGAR